MPPHDLVLTRVFDAPRELVWRAFSDPEQFKRWWGPKDFTAPHCVMEFRKGGRYHWCMRAPDGNDFWTAGEFLAVDPMDRIVYTDGFADAEGNIVPPSRYGMPGEAPMSTTVTVLFQDHETGTKMTLTHKDAKLFQGAEEGWGQSLDKLAGSLARPFTVTRTFDAPRPLVWKAFTEADRMAAWWGPPGTTLRHSSMDLQPGGRYHFHSEFPDGKSVWGVFVYREITPMDRIVYLHSFSDEAGTVTSSPFGGPWPLRIHTSMLFADKGRKTEFTLRQFPLDANAEEEAAFTALFEGMTLGWGGTLDQLAAYLPGTRA